MLDDAALLAMLRAGLIGLPATGQDHPVPTDDQRPRGGTGRPGRGEAQIGVSTRARRPARSADGDVQPEEARARDGRIRRSRRRPPAAPRRCVDVAAFRNADALVHVVRRFADDGVPHVARIGRPGPRRAGDGRRTDPRGPRRRRATARTPREGPEEDAGRRNSRSEQDLLARCRTRSRTATPLRALDLAGDDLKRLRGFQFLSAKPLLLVLNLDEPTSPTSADAARAAETTGLTAFLARAGRWPSRCARRSSSRSRSSKPADAAAFLDGSRPERVGARSRHPRQLRPARLHLVLHRRRGRVPGVVDPARHPRAAGGRRDPHRHPARLHPRRGRRLRRPDRARLACRVPRHGEVRLEGKEYVVADGDIINFRFAT